MLRCWLNTQREDTHETRDAYVLAFFRVRYRNPGSRRNLAQLYGPIPVSCYGYDIGRWRHLKGHPTDIDRMRRNPQNFTFLYTYW